LANLFLKFQKNHRFLKKFEKNSNEMVEDKCFSTHFLNPGVPRKTEQGRHSQKYEKSENYCRLVPSPNLGITTVACPLLPG
jgi:hypothetical protein